MMANTTAISWIISLLSADDIFLINIALMNYQIYIPGGGSDNKQHLRNACLMMQTTWDGVSKKHDK